MIGPNSPSSGFSVVFIVMQIAVAVEREALHPVSQLDVQSDGK